MPPPALSRAAGAAAPAASSASPPPSSGSERLHEPGTAGWARTEALSRSSSQWTSFTVLALILTVIALWIKMFARPMKTPAQRNAVRITALYIYPVKSLAGVAVQKVSLDRLGLRWDRRWMLVSSATGRMVSQRDYPRLALVQPRIDEAAGVLRLSYPGMDILEIALQPKDSDVERLDTTLWDDTVRGQAYVDPRIGVWFGRILELPADRAPLRLVTTLPTAEHARPLASAFDRTEGSGVQAAFPDEFPVSLASEASLKQVNTWTQPKGREVEMLAFRPNIVITGRTLKPFAEDLWRRISFEPEDLGVTTSNSAPPPQPTQFLVCKPAGRCVLTTVVPSEGKFHPSGEPLLSLREHRRILEHVPSQKGNACFAQLLAPVALEGELRVGDLMKLYEKKQHVYEPAEGKEPEADRELVEKQKKEVREAEEAKQAGSSSSSSSSSSSNKDKKDQ